MLILYRLFSSVSKMNLPKITSWRTTLRMKRCLEEHINKRQSNSSTRLLNMRERLKNLPYVAIQLFTLHYPRVVVPVS